jgi:hypothetical protein
MKVEYPNVYCIAENKKGIKFMYSLYHGVDHVVAKVCTNCNEWHFLNGFNKAGKGFAGRHSLCKTCHRQRNAEYRLDKQLENEFNKMVTEEMLKIRRNWF